MQNTTVTEDLQLVVDIRKSQICDFDNLLKCNLFSILRKDSQEKKDLNYYQELIEKLERKVDAGVRVKAAKWKNQVEGKDSSQSDPEITQWQGELDNLRTDRQKILDRLLNQCLEKMLPICNDKELHHYLTGYSEARLDSQDESYALFVNACNRAFECMNNLPGNIFRPASSLNCRFHRNVFESDYTASTVHTKPDVVVTSSLSVAAGNCRHQSDDPSVQCHEPPKMRQTLCCGEFRRSKRHLTANQECQFDDGWSDNEWSVRSSPLDEADSTVEIEESPADPNNLKNMAEGQIQCAIYAMAMLSYVSGVHHAITLLFIDCQLWVWYYDRKGAIQSSGIDFIQDLPRFLVLLFTFQRFDLTDWGVITKSNPDAELTHNRFPDSAHLNENKSRAAHNTQLERDEEPQKCILKPESLYAESLGEMCKDLKEIRIDLSDWLSHKPRCLGGCATAIIGASDLTVSKLACKVSFPKISREIGGRITEELHREIEKYSKMPQLLKHPLEVLMYGDLLRYSTQHIRNMLKMQTNECRTLRILVSKKMVPLTYLVGVEFVKAWLEVVKFHAFLWRRDIDHGDPSLWNVMYNEDSKCGVLIDYDLSTFRRRPRIPGTDRTPSIPFMALELLYDGYWRGEIERSYRHELEAFIWILPFVFLRYQNERPQQGTVVDLWMTSNYITCRKEKAVWMLPSTLEDQEQFCQSDFRDLWVLAVHLLDWLRVSVRWRQQKKVNGSWFRRNGKMSNVVEGLRRLWSLLKWNNTDASRNREGTMNRISEADDENGVTSLWPLFVDQLRLAARSPSQIGFIEKLIKDLALDRI